MASDIRTSQRAPKACLRCARMRIKCDKRIPCQTCAMRGLESSCARETVRVRGRIISTGLTETPPTYAELLEENHRLKISLERSLEPRGMTAGSHYPSFVEAFENEVQDINLRRSSQVQTTADIYVPTLACSRALLEHGAIWTSWIHFAVHIPTFRAEHEYYWGKAEARTNAFLDQDPFWLALYFAFIAMSLLFMNENEAVKAGLQEANITKHIGQWYDASLYFLDRADYLRNHDLRAIQAIAILLGLFKNVGDFSLYSIMLSIGIQIGRNLGIDTMDSDSGDGLNPWSQSFIEREVARRAWWTLVICDWLQQPPPRSPCIRESDFDVRLPLNLDDEELQNPEFQAQPSSAPVRPRPVQYHLIMIALSRLCHRFRLEKRFVRNESDELEQLVLRTDEALANVIDGLPDHLQGDHEDGHSDKTTHPLWSWQRDSLSLTFLFYRMAINRVMQQQWVQSPHSYVRTQAVCLGSARAIVTLVDRYRAAQARHRPWATASNLFSAVITLAIEARFSDRHTADEYKEDINRCLVFFNGIKDQNVVAARAVDVVQRYMETSMETQDGQDGQDGHA